MDAHERGELLRKRFRAIGGHVLTLEHKPRKNTAPLTPTGRHYGPFYGVSLCEDRCQWVSKSDEKKVRANPNDAEKKAIEAICEKAPRKLKRDAVKLSEVKGDGGLKVFQLLGKTIGQTGKAAHVHPHGEILPLNDRSADALWRANYGGARHKFDARR